MLNSPESVVLAQAIAATSCMLTVEGFVQLYAQPSTLALVIYENNDQCKKLVKSMHKEMRNPETLKKLGDPKEVARMKQRIPLQRVIDTAHFAEKSEAPILQLADVCAYFIKRRMMERMDSMCFLNHILNHLTSNAYSHWPMGRAY